VEDLKAILDEVVLAKRVDSWKWKHSPNGIYYIRNAYETFSSPTLWVGVGPEDIASILHKV